MVVGARNSGIAEKEESLVCGLIFASSLVPCVPNSHRGDQGVKDFKLDYTCFPRRLQMGRRRSQKRLIPGPRQALFTAVVVAALGVAGCSSGTVSAPSPRPIVVSSGARLRADTARIDSIFAWLSVASRRIQEDPSFLIDEVPTARETEPWRTLTIVGDTARIQYDRAHPDITTAYDIYATFHLMKKMGKLEEWVPGHGNDEGYALERVIIDRMADAWLLGRTGG
jgi:hypothetical protein